MMPVCASNGSGICGSLGADYQQWADGRRLAGFDDRFGGGIVGLVHCLAGRLPEEWAGPC